MQDYDYIIIGAGIIGINIAKAIINKYPKRSLLILEKEPEIAMHSSGRNSGVLHTGFYYKPDSLKAKFTQMGNIAMTKYCEKNNLKINKCGKVVVTSSENELSTLHELYQRGQHNGSKIVLIDKKELADLEPNAITFEKALFSPYTATVNPKEVLFHMLTELQSLNQVTVKFGEGYKSILNGNSVLTTTGSYFSAGMIINAAGLYADKIAKDFGFSQNYVIIPFKGIYLKYTGRNLKIKHNIYPVPNMNNPFLGVHFTVTVNNEIKIGPTAIPVLWREGYKGLDNFRFKEFLDIIFWESKLFFKNSFNFRGLAFDEIKKYYRPHLLGIAENMVQKLDSKGFNIWSAPGIRAQLLNKTTLELLQDFVIEGDNNSLHILNAVSPGFTCSIPFAEWIVENYLNCKLTQQGTSSG
ncbi:MAG: L-2-hydroxyglutarate oxidase [Burkholderiales bacterium]|nr:L-2-hydroxyglutarate oxidase [Burkholderiales bacterium]